MASGKPAQIPYPLSSFPGGNLQESGGRLINCTSEPLGEANRPTGSAPQVWRRQPGLTQYNLQQTGQTGYRGGLSVSNTSYEAWSGNASTFDKHGNYTSRGSFPGTQKVSMAKNLASVPDVLAVDLANGLYILDTATLVNATVQATIGGTTLNNTDTVNLVFNNLSVTGLPVTVTYPLGAGETTTTVATGVKNAINANTTLAAASITANSAAAVVTITEPGAIGNATQISSFVTGTGNETVTFNNAGGQLAGGSGTSGVTFTNGVSAPLSFNFGGVLPQPNSVCFQDGYFFFTVGNGQVFASGINSLTMNALSFINVVSHADITLQRGIAYMGLLLLFTSGSLELWQDTAQPYPGFPYSRMLVVEYGLIQPNAIAGWETGFSELSWDGQDFGVSCIKQGTPTPGKVSPPDLDRAIEAEIRKGNTLEASCYIFAGKKFWVLSSPDWSWEFNIQTKKWNERQSFNSATGIFGRWRATGGHPGTQTGAGQGKWLMGDTSSGNLIYPDDQNYTELGILQLFRIESGPVRDFPNQIRIARADFDFDMGVGIAVANTVMTVLGAVTDPLGTGQIQLQVHTTANVLTGDTVNVSSVGGTVEANGTWLVNVVDGTHILLRTSVFVHAYTSGGTAVDVTQPANVITPSVAISLSKNGGISWGNPLIRQLGMQLKTKGVRASVKN